MTIRKALMSIALGTLSSLAFAGTFSVTAPRTNDFLGKTNTLRFTVNGGVVQSNVTVRAILVSNPLITFTRSQLFTPNSEGNIDGSLPLNFDRSTTEGLYRLEVSIAEPGNTYTPNPVILTNITIDVVEPKFLDSNPIANSFVRGVVPIIAEIQENPTSLEEWRVQVNGNDIPNNTSNTNLINVTWDTSSIERDGGQNITITAKDKAQNTATPLNIGVTIDRVAPSIVIATPPANFSFRRGTIIPVSVDFVDQFGGAMSNLGVDLLVTNMSGTVLGRVTRISTQVQGNTLKFVGRILNTRNLPSPFKIKITGADKAGNIATGQEVVVNLR